MTVIYSKNKVILDWTCSTEEQITTAKLFSDGYQRVKLKKDIPGPPGGRTEKKEWEKSLSWEQAFLSCKGPRIKTDLFVFLWTTWHPKD